MAQHQAKDASKHPSKAGETSGDSSDKLSRISEMYRAPGNRNKKMVSNSGPVSSTKSSVKGGSPAKKSKVEDSRFAHAEPPHVAKKGSYPLDNSPKKHIKQGSRSMERPSKSSFGQDLLEIDLRRKIGTKSPKPNSQVTPNPYAVPPPGHNPNPPPVTTWQPFSSPQAPF